MMRFRIYSILLVVFGLLFGNGLQAQQILPDQPVQAVPLPDWRLPVGTNADPGKAMSKKFSPTAQGKLQLDQNLPIYQLPQERIIEKGSVEISLKGKTDANAKAFSDLILVEQPFFASPQGFNVYVLIENSAGEFFQCTGAFIDPKVVVLAGHCVYDEDLFDGFVENITILPAFDGNFISIYRSAESAETITTSGWIDNGDLEQDFALITLDRPIGATVGWWIAEEDGDPERFDFGVLNDFGFATRSFSNEGYPIGGDFEGDRMYSWSGQFDETEENLVYHDKESFPGQDGGLAYYLEGERPTGAAVLSHNREGSTGYVRITDERADLILETIEEITPDDPNLAPLPSPLFSNFIDTQDDPGAPLDTLILGVTNYSESDFNGDVLWGVVLSTDQEISEDDIVVGGLSVSGFNLPAKQSAFFNGGGVLTIPEDVPPGDYFLAAFISGEDADVSDDFPLESDFTPIQIGAGAIALAVDPSEISVDGQAGSTTFDITSAIAWSITEDADWLTVSASRGNGDATITVEYDQNPSTMEDRTATITVAAFDGSADPVTVTITQEALANFLTVTPDTLRVGGEAGTSSFAINTDLLWTVQESSEWFDANPTSGFGEGTVDLNYDRNSTDEVRTSIINVTTNEGPSAEVVVIQESAGALETISVDPAAVNVDAAAGEVEIRVSSNTNWVAGGGDEWVSFAPSAGEGDNIVTVKYDENTSLDSRQATITFSTGSGEMATVVITQSGAAAFVAVDPMMLNVGNVEGDASVAVSSNESWMASSDSDWLVVIPDAGSGNADIVVSYLGNDEIETRTGTITFTAASGETATLTVNQEGRPRVTVVDVVVNSEVHETLETAVIAAGLAGTLSGEGPFTVFAPTDDAFAALPEGTVETLLADPMGDLANILQYHVLGARVLSTDLSDGQVATTLLGEDITVTINDDGVFINDAQVTVADIETDNGVVHVINAVLLPPVDCEEVVEGGMVSLADGSTEVTTITGDGQADELFFMSMGAAEDAEFTYVITDDNNVILGIPGGNMADFEGTEPGACRVWGLSYTGDIIAMMGDNAAEVDLSSECFELSSNFITVTREEFMLPATVVDIVVNSEVHETLEAAVIAAELADDLSGEGPFTVFAPTDDAFAALPEGTVEMLLEDPTGDLANILLYHVLGAKVLSTDLSDGQVAETLLGENITVTINNEGVFINDAQVIIADIEAQNGVVHVIDAVLLPPPPPSTTVVDIIVNSEVHETLEAAVIAAELDDDLSGEGPFTVFAPTDDAFAALPEGTVEMLLEDPTGDLANILLYHVLGAEVLSTDLSDGQVATTLLNEDITVTINDEGIFINDAQVTVADIQADNGVVHVIDAVLLPPAPLPATVVDIIVNSEVHETLEAAVIAAELDDDLSGEGPFTVFAPTDDAFAALPEGTVEMLLEDPTGDLADILLYHVLGAKVLSTDLSDGQVATTLLNEDITVSIDADGNVFINNAQVIIADLEAQNGVVHVIDAVLLPPVNCEGKVAGGTVALEDGSTEATVTVGDGEADELSFMSMGAAEDAEFTYVITDDNNIILGVPGGNSENFEGAGAGVCRVWGLSYTGDIIAMAGDNAAEVDLSSECFELSSNFITVTREEFMLPATVVDIIVNSEVHETLEAAVIAAELDDDLSGEGPFTVFAPTDDAFAALPEGTVEMLLEDPTGDLADILLYHVLGAKVLSTDLNDGQVATTLLNEDITVSIDADGNVFINNAQVIIADLEAQNGVVHVIDAVLLPPVNCEGKVAGGTVALEDGSTEATVTVGDGEADELSFMSMGAAEDANFTYVITDDNNIILGVPGGNSENFEGAGAGICRVWGLSYTGDIIAMAGDNAAEVDLSSECFELSSNFITVTREEFMLPATVVDIIVNSEVHNTLETAVGVAGLADDLSGEGPFTVFAPTDDAFAALPEGVLEALLEEPTGDLQSILLYHVLAGKVLSTDLSDGQVATTLLGEDITVTINDDGVFINNAQVIIADLEAQNGVVHVIDAVLLPPPPPPTTVVDIIVNSEVHETLEAAVIAAELADDLSGEGPFTVFAPTDDAFAALPEGTLEALLEDPTGDLANILLYHVLGAEVLSTDLSDGQVATTLLGEDITVTINDEGIFINDAQVTVADIQADNGVVHVIDAVLLPPAPLPATVVDIIVNSEVHETLEAAVIAAELDDDLSGEGPFTVFAPTDDAFAALPEGTLEALLEDPTGDLANILLYHVLGAKVLSTDLSDGQVATTLLGEDITVTINDDGVFINDAQVIIADLEAQNGVVHVIDAVLLPPADPCEGKVDGGTVALADGSTSATVTVGDGEADELSFTSEGANPEANFTYVITDDNNIILGIPGGNSENFEGAGAGICRVWGLSYTGDIIAMAGDNAAEVDLSDDCFDLSDNFITVTREEEDDRDLPATVVEIIQNSDDHKTLEVALILAGLIDDLSGEGPFTVFAPTDAAFSALPSGLLDKLLTNASDGRLGNILLYHVLAGKVLSSDLSDGQVATTLLGEDITVTIDADGNIFINNAQVTIADIEAENGVVHVIDAVLVPEIEDNSRFLEIRPPSKSVNQDAGETVFVVFTNTDWSITTDAEDVEFFPSVGSGTRFIKVVYGENTEGPAREVVLNIESTTGESGEFTLTQAGTDDFVAISPENVFVRAVQGSTSFDLVSSTDWTLSTDSDWITLTTDSGSGNATVSIDYDSNPSFEIRTGTVTATTPNGATASISISQGASEDVEIFFELRPESREVSSAAGEVQFVIFTNAIWNISSDAAWVEFFGTEGQGTAFIKVPYQANMTGESRTAELDVVTSTGESGTFTLTQTAEGAFIINNPDVDAPATIANFDMTLYPNPVSTSLNVRIDADADRAIDVQVLDVNGKLVKYYNSQPLFKGANTIQIQVDDLANGVYYFRMVGDDVVKQTKFMVAQ